MADAVAYPGPAQVGLEDLMVGLAVLGCTIPFLRPAIVSPVGIDCDDFAGLGGGQCRHNRRTAVVAPDFDDSAPIADALRRVPEPLGLVNAHPTLDIGDLSPGRVKVGWGYGVVNHVNAPFARENRGRVRPRFCRIVDECGGSGCCQPTAAASAGHTTGTEHHEAESDSGDP